MAATLVRAEEAPKFEVHGTHFTGHASPSRGSASLATWRVKIDAGIKSPVHSLDSDEVFVCLAGHAASTSASRSST